MNYGWEIVKIIFYLLLVLGLIYLVIYFLRKTLTKTGKGRYIKVIEQIYLSPKQSLVLIMINDVVLLLSNSNEQIRVLNRWEQAEFKEKEPAAVSTASFKDYWHRLTRDNRREHND